MTSVFATERAVKRGCEKIQNDVASGAYAHVGGNLCALFRAIANSTSVMGGSSGAFTVAFFKAAADKFAGTSDQEDENMWKSAFIAGFEGVTKITDAWIGDRTFVDALKPAVDALSQNGGTLAQAAFAAKNGYEATKDMPAGRFGRTANVRPESLIGQPDPGAYAVSVALGALVEAQENDTHA